MKKTIAMVAAALSAFASTVTMTATDVPDENISYVMKLYSCQRAYRKGDILTVLVTESTVSSKTDNMATSKESLAEAEAPVFGAFGFPNGGPSISSISDHFALPSYKIKAASSFKGAGSGNSQEKLTTSYGVLVVDVLENGILVVRGERFVRLKKETVNMVITGLVRVRDIDADNMIYSTQIANAHIYYENAGEVTRGANPGWFWHIFQYLNPF